MKYMPDITVLLNEIFAIEEIPSDQDLFSTGIIDSFGMVSLIIAIEEKFSIELDPERLTPEHFSSIDKISQFLETIIGD